MIKVFYVATKTTTGVYNYQQSLNQSGYDHHRLAEGQKWGGWRFRMQVYQEACAREAPNTILILTDADDVLSIRKPDGVLEAFQQFQKPIVVSAETLCLSNCKSLDRYWAANPHTDQPSYRYANCGCLMGRAGNLAAMWQWMLDRDFQDDQIGLGHYIESFPENIALDTGGHLFYVVPPPVKRSDPQILSSDNTDLLSLKDQIDGHICSPYFLHFAGNFVEPSITAAFLPNPKAHLYDVISNRVLGAKAMSYFQTNVLGHSISVVVVWTLVGLLVILVFALCCCFLFYRSRQKKSSTSTK